jgi:hypothetical protein
LNYQEKGVERRPFYFRVRSGRLFVFPAEGYQDGGIGEVVLQAVFFDSFAADEYLARFAGYLRLFASRKIFNIYFARFFIIPKDGKAFKFAEYSYRAGKLSDIPQDVGGACIIALVYRYPPRGRNGESSRRISRSRYIWVFGFFFYFRNSGGLTFLAIILGADCSI